MKFDVFVSFRGSDTRRTFVSHLLHSLERSGYRIFKHDDDTLANQPASSQVLQAIEDSKVGVAVISQNYASSVWCLDELSKMTECKENSLMQVLPIFYEVNRLDVARQAHNLTINSTVERTYLGKVKRWYEALTRLPTGYSSREWGGDSDMIDAIVSHISRHLFITRPPAPCEDAQALGHTSIFATDDLSSTDLLTMTIQDGGDVVGTMAGRYIPGDKPIRVQPMHESSTSINFTSLVGMDRHMKAMYTLLDLELDDEVREIGIWGAEGVGKTTLARFVYEQTSPCFQDHYYFMNDTSGYCRGRSSPCLLENITRDVMMGCNPAMIRNVVKARLGHKKVLLIVDGLDVYSQLQNITIVAQWFGRGSRLIAVEKNKDFLINHGIEQVYKVESMRYDEALQLFSQSAFKQEYIPAGFDPLSARAVLIAGHVPFAIKVLGSFLYGRDIKEWESVLCKLEAAQDNWTFAIVSSYVGGEFYRRRLTKLDRCIGEEDDEGDEFPLYHFALG